jgi:hypothetical protein
MRFEIKPSIWTLATVQVALGKTRMASRISKRHYGGLRNQPYAVTFAADNHEHALAICELARTHLPDPDLLPSLLPFVYGPGFVWQTFGNVSRLVKGDQHGQ